MKAKIRDKQSYVPGHVFQRIFRNANLKVGDRVRLDVRQIRKHPDWDLLSTKYRLFIESNDRTVFTVQEIRGGAHGSLVILKEAPEWLFWRGDLIPAEEK